MKLFLATIIIFVSFISINGQTFYGLTFMKPYSKQEIASHFWDSEVSTGEYNSIKVLRNGKEIHLEFGSNDKNGKYNANMLVRILSFDLEESNGQSMYEDCKLLFGKPIGGFEEEHLQTDNLYNYQSVKEKNYYFYYLDKYIKGDMLEVHFEVESVGYCGGKLCKSVTFDINYHSRFWKIGESKKSNSYNKDWIIIKQF